MARTTSLTLALLFTVLTGCVAPPDGSSFERGGERPADADELPHWGVDNCLAGSDLGGEGPGQMTLPWLLQDAWDRPVRLHDFCGRVIFIESIEANDPELQERLAELEALRSSFGFWELAVVVLIAHRDASGVASHELRDLTHDLDLRFPLLSDPDWSVTRRYTGTAPTGRSIQLYSPGLVLEATGLRSAGVDEVEALLGDGMML